MTSGKTRYRRTGPLHGLFGWAIVGLPILTALGLLCGSLGAGLGMYLYYAEDLPKMPDLRAYRPKTVSTFYAEDGTTIGLFYKEKRFPVLLKDLPPHVINAFLAAEDGRFFSHTGIDFFSIIRALLKNLHSGSYAQGGSTITQQVTRNFLLSKEKKISRKIREAILSFRLEKTLTKEEILGIYLNEIYLGKGAYGVEAAARTYFGKNARELTIAEAAVLAGSTSNPTKFSPSRNPETSLKRKEFVLDNMLRYGFISNEQYQEASAEQPKVVEEDPTNPYERVPYFTEAVRRYIVERYGAQRLYNEGLEVWTTCDVSLQGKASESLLKGAKAWEKRQGRPEGLVRRLTRTEVKDFLHTSAKDSLRPGDTIRGLVVAVQTVKTPKGKKQKSSAQDCTIALPGDARVQMLLESPVPYRINQLLEFRVTDVNEDGPILALQTLPPIQGAVVCIENRTGYVRALVGGLDFERSSFNRAVQALRQPGSAFKPLIYAAALEWGNYSPQTLILDEPIAVMFNPRKGEWIPGNSDGKYLGLITLKDALTYSRNTVAVKLLMDLGVDPVTRMARRMGITSHLDRNLSLSLGTSEVSPLELTSAYTVFPNMGMRLGPVLVKKVKDRFGNVLEDNTVTPLDVEGETARFVPPTEGFHASDRQDQEYEEDEHVVQDESEENTQQQLGSLPSTEECPTEIHELNPEIEALMSGSFRTAGVTSRPPAERVLNPMSAYLMLNMLRKVCTSGTAAALSRFKHGEPAGKTGTTDDFSDAWFVGFSPKYTTGVWVGYDTKTSLGRGEYGGKTALPVWMDFMKDLLHKDTSMHYPPPAGIVFNRQGGPGGAENPTNFLEGDPDYFSTAGIKPVSPIDFNLILASAPNTSFLTEAAAGHYWDYGLDQGSSVRVFTPSGQDLGFASYQHDEKGNTVLRRDWLIQQENTGNGAEFDQKQPTDAVDMGARLLGSSPPMHGWNR